MTTVAIYKEHSDLSTACFRAVAGNRQSVGQTAGQALDALNAQLGNDESGSLVIIQQMQSDPYFSEAQYLRMRDLLDRSSALTDPERAELEQLVREELIASAKRAEALANALGR